MRRLIHGADGRGGGHHAARGAACWGIAWGVAQVTDERKVVNFIIGHTGLVGRSGTFRVNGVYAGVPGEGKDASRFDWGKTHVVFQVFIFLTVLLIL